MNENILNDEMKEAIAERNRIKNMLTKNQYNRILQYEESHGVTLTTDEIMQRVRVKGNCAKCTKK